MKDYIIFDHAPTITFTCNEPIHDWYADTWDPASQGGEPQERTRITGTITTSGCANDFVLQNVAADIKIRGNYTANYSKKPFQIRFAEKQNLFGLNDGNKHKKWILLAEYNDSSMLRNNLALYMARKIMQDQWVPSTTYAHFYIQDSETTYYMGLFTLVDQKEQGKNRINVFEPEAGYSGTDIGYFFERDDYYESEDDPSFTLADSDYIPAAPVKTSHSSNKWARQAHQSILNVDGFTIHSKITDAETQIPYLKARMLKIYEILYRAVNENTLYELDINNNLIPSESNDPAEVLNKTINLQSFVNRYILEELCCNGDISHSSFYFTLDMSETGDKRLALACPWDYDLALGISPYFAPNPDDTGLWVKYCSMNPWISLLANTTWFMRLVKARWQELVGNYFCGWCSFILDRYSSQYTDDFAINFTEWSITWGEHRTWNLDAKNHVTPTVFVLPEYYQPWRVHTEADLKIRTQNWVRRRLEAINRLFEGPEWIDWSLGPVPETDGIYSCIKEDGKLILKPTELYGSVRVLVGQKATPSNIARLIYELTQEGGKNFIRLDLETGGNYDSSVEGYRNWFPGSKTFGLNTTADINVYTDYERTQPLIIDDQQVYIPVFAGGHTKEEATFEILDILDDVLTDPTWKIRLNISYHIITADGYTGYIDATAVNNIFYREAPTPTIGE